MPYTREAAYRTGRRVDTASERQSAYRVSQPGRRVAGQKRGKREQVSARRERRRLWQMLISAMLLITVIGVKLAAPDVVNQYRDKILGWMNEETDFVSAFSAVGRAVEDGGWGDAIGEAYQEVFGPSETEQVEKTSEKTEPAPEKSGESGQADEKKKQDTKAPAKKEKAEQVVYSAENLPQDVCMTQQVLGFAYADPLKGKLTSCFGYRQHPVDGNEKFHYGLDIGADQGTVISSFADGLVTAVGESSELGNYVMVSHDGGYTTLYAHCSRVTASSGQTVKCGDPIAEVGETGRATGPHLHFELHQNTTYLNPIYYVSL
ncbi:MAG: M23 family metallopeptidase [Clostridiales bacterium]|nr:M23 family metallopeptidase [Candidatus Cacconaster stercorequi]